jgi:protein-tyrosine sulfotransferase
MPQKPMHDGRLADSAAVTADPLALETPVLCDSPVFILTASRSGSTLLRVMLDSHPRLACPPETMITSACMQLAMTCDVLENAGSASLAADDSGTLPAAIRATVRAAVDRAYGPYLAHRGKQRWCDKSLDSYMHAELMAQVYPEAKFICLFRHCMDVIASGVEACPWGLQRYGFDPFVAQHPGNSVAAVGSYWLSCAQAILSFGEDHPGSCHQVRYEDLVTAPEETVAGILSFLGEQQVPGITQACFDTPHEVNGPADEKLWFTSAVTAGSIGRGTIVPASALPKPVRGPINEVLGRLGYRPVDDHWNDAASGTDPRLSASPVPSPRSASAGEAESGEVDAAAALITTRLRSQPSHMVSEIASYWPAVAGKTIAIVIEDGGYGRAELRQTFPPVSSPDAADRVPGTEADLDAVAATITASPATWQSLLAGRTNLVTELTASRIRCVRIADDHDHADCIQGHHPTGALRAIAALLGISKIPVAGPPTATPRR